MGKPQAPDEGKEWISNDLRTKIFLAVVLALATAVLYGPSLRNGFVNFDDPPFVLKNAHVQGGLSAAGIAWALTASYEANWYPVTWISHMADVQFYGNNPAGHHCTSLLLHAINVAVLFLLLERATRKLWRSAIVAALFAALPLNVESVAWIAERKTLLCTLFLLLTILAYAWYTQKPSVPRYAAVSALFALGLAAKPMIITLPFALLLLDYWPLERLPVPGNTGTEQFLPKFVSLFAEKVPLLALSAASSWITVYAARVGHAFGSAAALPLIWRLKNAVNSCVMYLFKGVWPTKLAVLYPHTENSLPWWTVTIALLFLLGITALAWRLREKRYLLSGWLWYLAMLLPVLGILQAGRQGMADRYAYISFLGLFVALVWLAGDWVATARIPIQIPVAASALVLLAYALVTHHQLAYWKNSFTLFSHTLEVTQNNGLAEQNLGEALAQMGQPQAAMPHFEAAIRLIPQLAVAHYNLGTMLQLQKRLNEAAHEYGLALQYGLDNDEAAQAHNNMGILLIDAGQPELATKELNQAIALNPREQNSYIGRGMIEYQGGDWKSATADFYSAARLAPSPVACFWLGRALESAGQIAQAKQAYAESLRLMPGLADARARLDALNALGPIK